MKHEKNFSFNEKKKELTISSHITEVFTAEQLIGLWHSFNETLGSLEAQLKRAKESIPDFEAKINEVKGYIEELRPYYKKVTPEEKNESIG